MNARWIWIVLVVLGAAVSWQYYGSQKTTAPKENVSVIKKSQQEGAQDRQEALPQDPVTEPLSSVKAVPKRKLVVDDPAKYGMVVIASEAMPKSPQDLDQYLGEVLAEKKIFETTEGQKMIAPFKVASEKFQQEMTKLENEIMNQEKIAKEHPLDEAVKKQLESLYHLHAVNKALEKHIVKTGMGE